MLAPQPGPGLALAPSGDTLAQRRYLPADPSSLIGRADDIDATRELLLRADVRLVTLTGPAGTGKTRLAVAVARQVRGAFADGACFVDLAPLSEPGQVVGAIARATDLRELDGAPLLIALQRALL